jgi:toxin YoeB
MTMRLSWYSDAWEDYRYWQTYDKKTLKKINDLLKDIMRNNYTGIGKPEPLKVNLAGWWSRRINDVDRLVYRIDGEICIILQCKGHYDG